MIASLGLIIDRMSATGQFVMQCISSAAMIAFMCLTFYGNLEILSFAKGKVSSILGMDMRLIYSAWSVAAVLMLFYAVEKIGLAYSVWQEAKNTHTKELEK